jgi:hypothetical protein
MWGSLWAWLSALTLIPCLLMDGDSWGPQHPPGLSQNQEQLRVQPLTRSFQKEVP